MAEEKRTVGGQPVIDNVPLKHEPKDSSDWCMHCDVNLCSGDPRADQPCMGLERARRRQIAPESLLAFGCDREANGGDRCAKWCQGTECAYTRGAAAEQSPLMAALEQAEKAAEAYSNAVEGGAAISPRGVKVDGQTLPQQPTPSPIEQEPVAWRCFHCEETFTDEAAAAEHFGTRLAQSAACTINVAEYRRMEETHRRHCEEDTDLHRQIHALAGRVDPQEVRRAEEKGYERGLRDGVNLPADSAERAVLATPSEAVQGKEKQE